MLLLLRELLLSRTSFMRTLLVLALLASPFSWAQPGGELPHDLSALGMFQQADWVVKAVMVGLVLASVLTWTVWVTKTIELRRARASNKAPMAQLASAATLESCEFLQGDSPARALLAAAHEELAQSERLPSAGIKERLDARFARIQSAVARRAKLGTGTLATVGSTGPFVGLFGTVWGIMNSFVSISQAQTTNLAVVAPGIAEALLATALGLVAAIPAVVMYNIFARKITDYRAEVADMAGEVMRLVSLQLDRQGRE